MRKNIFVLSIIVVPMFLFGQTATAPSEGDGSSGNPYQISTIGNLYWIAASTARWGACYKQTADIDASSTSTWSGGAGWTPIGNGTTSFTGAYNGDSHTISGLFINRLTEYYTGFFGIVYNATISNLGLINLNINGMSIVGGLMSNCVGTTTVSNCYSKGTVTGSTDVIGGLVGVNRATISNSYSECTVTSNTSTSGNRIGGLVGENSGIITSSHSTGNVTSVSAPSSNNYSVGGFVGHNGNDMDGTNKIENCYSTGNVFGIRTVGGFVGRNLNIDSEGQSDALITRCYSTGNVSATTEVGGFVGCVDYSGGGGGGMGGPTYYGILSNCYSFGNVTRSSGSVTNFGGFVGLNRNSKIINSYSTGWVKFGASAQTDRGFCGAISVDTKYAMTGNIWNTETSNASSSSGTATGKSTAQMKSVATYIAAGWDATGTIWKIDETTTINSGYPFFAWQDAGGSALTVHQPTNLLLTSKITSGNNDIVVNFTASATATNYLVVRSTGADAPTFIPSDATSYSVGAQGSDQILSVGTSTSVTDATVTSGTKYNYKVYAFNGSGGSEDYLVTDPLSGSTIVNAAGSGIIGSGSASVSSNFPTQCVDVTFPNGSTGTNLTVAKTNSTPVSNFAALPNVRGISNMYFSITSSNATPGTYTLVLDFSSLGLLEAVWNKFVIMKRSNSTAAWQNITTLGGTITNRQTDGVWGKFTITGLSSFSEFAGGEEATVFTVTSAADDGAGTLRQAATDNEVGDIITFNVTAMGTNTITVLSPIQLNNDVTIRGANGGIILNGNNASKVLVNGIDAVQSPIVRLENLIIKNGDDTDNRVGGIDNFGDMTLVNCVIADNADLGFSGELGAVGGILSNGAVTLVNCTVAHNAGPSTKDGVGGIFCSGELKIYNSIVYGNTGEFNNLGSNVTLSRHSLFEGLDSYVKQDQEHDLAEGTDPKFFGSGLHPYAINGNSPCADAGDDSYSFDTYDIRGNGRKLNMTSGATGTIDMGAYEYVVSVDPLPVELKAFTATSIKTGLKLAWTTATEVNNYKFEIEKATFVAGNQLLVWSKIGEVVGGGTSNAVRHYCFDDNNVNHGTYSYRLKQIDNDGKFAYSHVIEAIVNVLPEYFELSQNYPNPFNPATTINYQLAVNSNVQLRIYDILGKDVATLVNGKQDAGRYCVTFDASTLAGGMYFARVRAGSFIKTIKMQLVK